MTPRAKWFSSRNGRPDDRFGQLEAGRARCICGEVLAFKWLEDAASYAKDAPPKLRAFRKAFRLPPGNVHRDGEHLPFGFWELSRRAQAQRRQALLGGRRLSEWRPTPRHRQSQEEHERVITQVNSGAIPGVIGVGEGTAREAAIYIVDPYATGGLVVVKCAGCGRLNEVPPFLWD